MIYLTFIYFTNCYFNFVSVSDACQGYDCGDNAVCMSVGSEAQCECENGYEGDGERCVDVNECEALGNKKHDCDVNAYCTNYEGRFSFHLTKDLKWKNIKRNDLQLYHDKISHLYLYLSTL